ncbi:MAG: type IV pilus modification protein PilV [Gallionellales bacterium GWE2_58_10]|nr:MAG: type IV pilus modification protein PilV [Gallionellales bacterium GWE2_58_10]OGT01614.1 MAG: type IV pilus modification protein PilV [Gallionellales bacterium RBG_16_57_15]
MNIFRSTLCRQSGTSMIEVLVTLIILLIGLLGLAGLQLHAQRSEMESYQRVQALVLLQDMVGRINVNRGVPACYDTTTLSPAYLGTNAAGTGIIAAPACAIGTAEQNAQAEQDMDDWSNLLAGAAEAGNTGAMLGGRGCVDFDAASSVAMVSVAWQGLGDTTAPPASLSCGTGLYGSEAKRRVVSLPVRFATLAAP